MTNTDVDRILQSDEVYGVLDKNPKLPLCTVRRGNPIKNKAVMATLNPSLAEDEHTRDQKRAGWAKSLNSKKQKLATLREARKKQLWAEMQALN